MKRVMIAISIMLYVGLVGIVNGKIPPGRLRWC